MTSVCVLVVNYNGVEHLDACLSTLLRAAASCGRRCPVVLVDNRSTDESVAQTRRNFPQVDVVVAPANDCLFSLNAVAASRTEDIVVIVNNDMRFEETFLAPLLEHFADPCVFAVGAAIRTWEGTADTVGPRCARLEAFWFHKWWSYDRQQTALTLEACGGAVAYRRTMFVELGGFDPLYRPGYYEDLDLSCRGWACGWRVVYEPRSRAYHKESATMIARFGDDAKARLLYRNHLLFTLKNVGGTGFLIGFLALLPYRVLSPLLRGYGVPLAGFVRALPFVPAALARRRRSRPRLDFTAFDHVTPVEAPHLAGAAVSAR
jgi:GT2 family glycosyltransferase